MSGTPESGHTIEPRHYAAALEEELARVNKERMLLRAALNQQAETLTEMTEDRDRWRDRHEHPADAGTGSAGDLNNKAPAHSGT